MKGGMRYMLQYNEYEVTIYQPTAEVMAHFGTSNVRKVLALRSVQAIRQAIAASRPAVLRPPAEGGRQSTKAPPAEGAGSAPRHHRQRGVPTKMVTIQRGIISDYDYDYYY